MSYDGNNEQEDVSLLKVYALKARENIGALLLFFVLAVAICVVLYSVIEPTYTAEATIGIKKDSALDEMSGVTSTSILSGKLGGTTSSSVFQDYRQVINSPMLVDELAKKDGFLQIIFYKRWDSENNRWQPPGALHNVASAVKRFLNIPVFDYPGVDQLAIYLNENFKVEELYSSGGGVLSAVSSGDTYLKVTMNANDPHQAETELNAILSRADNILKQKQLSNINSRIHYIQTQLKTITETDSRATFINVLSHQLEMKTMIMADKYYAFSMLSEPSASLIPGAPMKFIKAIELCAIISILIWAFLLYFEDKMILAQNILSGLRKITGLRVLGRKTGR